MANKQTLLELTQSNKSFQQWTRVKICQQAQTPNDKIIETTQKTIAAREGITVMCLACGKVNSH